VREMLSGVSAAPPAGETLPLIGCGGVVALAGFIGAGTTGRINGRRLGLAEVEGWLGARLLHRTTRRVSLTGPGEAALARFRQMLAIGEELQGELASEITRQIKIAVTPEEQTRLAGARPVNPEAYMAYLRGRYFWSQRSPESMPRALDYFQQAINLDPTYAAAYAGLADTYGVRAAEYLGLTWNERMARHKAAVEKALELDDSLAEAHASLGILKARDWEWSGAEQEYRRSIELNPSYATAHHWLSIFLFDLGKRPEEALRHARRAVELDPLSPVINSNLCDSLYLVGEYEQAIKQGQKTLQLDDKHWPAHLCLAEVYLELGQDDKAAQHEEQNILIDWGPEAASQIRKRYEAEGWPGVWRWYLEEFGARRARGEYILWINIAECHVRLGEVDKAMVALEKGYQRRDPFFQGIVTYPPLRPLHSDPRFQDLLRRMNLPN